MTLLVTDIIYSLRSLSCDGPITLSKESSPESAI
jgi:hypothetical protein